MSQTTEVPKVIERKAELYATYGVNDVWYTFDTEKKAFLAGAKLMEDICLKYAEWKGNDSWDDPGYTGAQLLNYFIENIYENGK